MSSRKLFNTKKPKELTFTIATILWIAGFLDVILGLYELPGRLGPWSLALAGLLLITAALVDGI